MDISPDKQNINSIFSGTTYFIDFYQRDYKWSEEPVRRLIDDIFYGFEESYKTNNALDAKIENVTAKYPWYYLSTFVTNTIAGRVYVVDGQQRLTTLTLILIKLHHMGNALGSGLVDWIRSKIAGQAGFEKQFWMNHELHLEALNALYDEKDKIPTDSGITAENMHQNYDSIDSILEQKLDSKHKYETFVFYFLHRLVLINLSVEQTDVPMVFEVINDRGVKLRPYEILKGKLLGQIDKIELDEGNYNALWEECVSRVNRFKSEEIDTFFVYLLKAKYAETRATGQRFDNDYHREIFKSDVNEKLKLDHNPVAVKAFLNGAFRYYSKLYAKIWEYTHDRQVGYEHLYFNRLNEMDSQFMLILSACEVDDPEEDEKIRLVAQNVDRLFSFLRLQRAYDSNDFNDAVFEISYEIRERGKEEINSAFYQTLRNILKERRSVDVSEVFEYAQFKNTSLNDIPARFTRYFFARIDEFIADKTNTAIKHPINDLVLKTGAVNGFHIEHILSHNDESLNIYGGDEELFEVDRNRLGAVLLLKGKDNISSGNEKYKSKLMSYANTLHWNETLRADSYKAKKDFKNLINDYDLQFQHLESFGAEQVESRQKLLFNIAKIIWKEHSLEAAPDDIEQPRSIGPL